MTNEKDKQAEHETLELWGEFNDSKQLKLKNKKHGI